MKSTIGLILFAKNEGTYGAGTALSGSTDTIQVASEFPIFNTQYSFDGNRNGAQWSGGNLRRTTPSGKTCEGTVKIEMKGLGAAYSSAAVTPPNIHPFLLSSGLSGSLTAGVWTYKPYALGTSVPGLALEVYDRGEMLPVSGSYCNFSLSSDGAGITHAEFKVQGLPGTITDVSSPPARAFVAATVIPPKNENIAFTLGSYTTANIRSYTYEHGQEITARINLNATGSHAGYAMGRRNPTFKITIEADAIATFNPYTDWQNATAKSLSLQVGTSGQNNAFQVNMASASLANVTRANDGPIALWELEYYPAVSTPDANDDVELKFIA